MKTFSMNPFKTDKITEQHNKIDKQETIKINNSNNRCKLVQETDSKIYSEWKK